MLKTRIKDLRIDSDLTQTDVANALGITQRKYSYIETEIQPLTDEIIFKLAKFYNVTSDYILYLSDKAN
ncbi:MAG: helix-turn-helix transcriptional regulator [Ruminococcaceae bacterium]|nr:helix-turn-helix transcriptional regulator [Oscillospiraceae bacterium]